MKSSSRAARFALGAAHVALGALLVLVDYTLASPLVGAGYGVRGVGALLLWGVGLWLLPLGAGDALPGWGNVRRSLAFSLRFLAALIPCALVLAAAALLVARWGGWRAGYSPSVIASAGEAAPYVLHGLVAAPLVEELIYRGLVYPRIRAGAGALFAVAASGPIFWVLHWVDRGGVTPVNHLIAGWILAWAFERTGSLLAPTALHALGNLTLLALDLLWLRHPDAFRAVLGA